MKNLIHEIHRRSLWQVLGIYLAGSWVALQVVEQLANAAALPDWVQPLALVLLIIGLPIVMATAFVQEGVGGGRRADVRAPGPPNAEADAGTAGDAASEAAGGAAKTGDAGPESPSSVVATAAEKSVATGSRGFFTWRRAALGGGAAFALLGVLTLGWLGSRAMGIGPAATLVAQGLFDERATVVLADFRADDPSLSRAATEAFKVDLSQSQVVRLAEPSYVRDALVRMERDPDEGLDVALAQELAEREGLPALIAGEINSAGGGYVLTAELQAAGTGDVLVSHRETAADESELIDALDALSKRIRERIGESIGSMASEPRLEAVTTSNLDALRRYSQAIAVIEGEGDERRGLELLEEAVEMDPEFAMAWRKLGTSLGNMNEQRSRQVEALTRAFDNQDRLTDRERFLAQATYYENVTTDRRRAIRAYDDMLDLDPEDIYALNNSGIVYAQLRDFAEAEDRYARALLADSTGYPPYFNLHVSQVNQGRWAAASETLELMGTRFPDSPNGLELRGWQSSAQGDWESARSDFEYLRDQTAGDPYWETEAETSLARLDAVQGRLVDAERRLEAAREVSGERGLVGRVIGQSVFLAFIELEARQNPAAATSLIEGVLEQYPLDELTALDRPYGGLIRFYAMAGMPDRARGYLEEYEGSVPAELRTSEEDTELAATLALAEGRHEDAIDGFRQRDTGLCLLCSVPDLADSYYAAGQADSAIVVYERFLKTPFLNRLFFDALGRPVVLERLAGLHDEAGNLQDAAKYYAEFVELWADADDDLQPRVRAAQARLEEIVREIG